jgi:ATP phosphoribosyltransferase regulatory subunit
MGQSIAQGGRYDDIGLDFGRARPATGFSTDLRLLVERGTIIGAERAKGIWAAYANVPGLQAEVMALRRKGERVIVALPGQMDSDAVEHGCDRILLWQGGAWQVNTLDY